MPRSLPPVATTIIALNVLVFFGEKLLGSDPFATFALWPAGTEPTQWTLPFEPWQLLTYAFLHGGEAHLFFNMFALFMFGFEIERLLGPARFLLYYLVCVVGAGLAQLWVIDMMNGPYAPTVGASGGVFGLLLAFGMAFPHRRIILLFPPIPMPAWVFVTLYGIAELVMGVTGTAQGVAHFAHLGGMAAGFLLIQFWKYRAREPKN